MQFDKDTQKFSVYYVRMSDIQMFQSNQYILIITAINFYLLLPCFIVIQ